MKEQISEEFAYKLFSEALTMSLNGESFNDGIIKIWKQKGYIKQSREEEIREALNNICFDFPQNFSFYERIILLQKELIEILDNKDKQC